MGRQSKKKAVHINGLHQSLQQKANAQLQGQIYLFFIEVIEFTNRGCYACISLELITLYTVLFVIY